jgi:hypothetical protein
MGWKSHCKRKQGKEKLAFTTSKTKQKVTLLISIRDVLGSNLGWDAPTIFTEDFRGLPQPAH